jgi:hypothetical protein
MSRIKLILSAVITVLVIIYVASYVALRNPAVEFARRYDYEGIFYLDMTQPPSQRRYYLLVTLHFLYWPLNQVDCFLFDGIQHSVRLPLYDLS